MTFIFKEGTSDILASLAEIEEKKNHAIIYPLPLSEEKEQVYITSFQSIQRVTTYLSLRQCYTKQFFLLLATQFWMRMLSIEYLLKRSQKELDSHYTETSIR